MRKECPDYLQRFPRPFMDDLVAGRVLPFVGAGFSKNAVMPPGVTVPDCGELARRLASQISGHAYANPTDATFAYEQAFGRVKLIEAIAAQLNREDVRPGPAHVAFAELPFDMVATTNFDCLLERACGRVGRPVNPVMYESQLSVFPEASPGSIMLLKIHGDCSNPDRIIVTERDYDTFATRFPLYGIYLANLFIIKTPLFIGYSLNDCDFRFVYESVSQRLGPLMRLGYTIQIDARPDDITRFERRGVCVINLQSHGLLPGSVLTCAFEQLRAYWLAHLVRDGVVTDEETRTALRQPSRAERRLCLCAASERLIAAYRKLVFPLLESHGFIPAAGDEIRGSGGQKTAPLMASAGEASAIIADQGHPYSAALVVRPPNVPVLFVAEDGGRPVHVARGVRVVTRAAGETLDPSVPEAIEQWLSELAAWPV